MITHDVMKCVDSKSFGGVIQEMIIKKASKTPVSNQNRFHATISAI